jgi:uncharacterized Zn finger protein/superfamily II DNA or RNA helicase
MVAKTYGRTWWGKKWLDAFNGIDDENRLPRGRTYANKGAVSNIQVHGNVVTARVQGSHPTPYKVGMSFNIFSKEEKNLIGQVIEKSPSILSSLANKRLSVKLYNELQKVGIKLFPTEWKEVKAYCSCPDWAVPCKHIAALLYMICDEIDKNPFIVFKLHDFDPKELLQNFVEYEIVQKPIMKIETLFDQKRARNGQNSFDQAVLDSIDLSKIPNLEATTFNILKSEVVFYEKKFQEKMYAFYNNLAMLKYGKESKEFLARFPLVELWNKFEISIDNQHKITDIDYGTSQKKQNESQVSNIYDFFQEMPNSLLHLLNPQLRFLHMICQFSAKLMEKKALIPQILQNDADETLIRWIPAFYNDEIAKIIDELAGIAPHIIKNMTNGREEVIALVAIFVKARILSMNLTRDKLIGDDILDVFFLGRPHKFATFSTKEIPHVINQWLSNFYLGKKSHKLYLEVNDTGDESFLLNLKVILEKQQEPLGLAQAFSKVSPSEKFDILSDISALADHLPDLENIIDSNKPISFGICDFTRIFFSILPVLKAIGVYIALPKSLRNLCSPRLTLSMKSKKRIEGCSSGHVSLESLLDFDWTVAIGDQNVSLEEFKKLLKKSSGLVRFAGSYVLLDEKQMESLLKQFDRLPTSLSQAEIIQAGLSGDYESASVKMDAQLTRLFTQMRQYQPKTIPHNLEAQLRPYQERGFSWLVQNIDMGFGSILADDMGLGKTLQVIAVALHLKNEGRLDNEKVLVIAPTSLLINWQREIMRFAPSLKPLIYHGNKRELNVDFDIVLTSYGLAYRDRNEFQKHNWLLLVIDEAQNIKNPLTLQTKSVKAIEAKHKIAMSGTPVENRLAEYWSIFDFTNRGYLGTYGNFRTKFALPIERERNKDCLDKFIRVTSPFILRRCKNDKSIIADLPEKIENNRYCSLTKEQAAIYQEILNSSMDNIEESEGINRKGLVLKLINSLKQICNHPSHYGKKPKALMEESGKTKMLEEILEEIHELGEKTLIFTQYTEMGKILVKLLEEKFKLPVPFLHGGLSSQKRDEIVRDFQENSQTRILILSLKAGGTGLNLTAANHVIHYDLWWNPAVEAQATDRAYRIGQKNNVMVHRLLTSGTFEERINEMIHSKKDLANMTVSDGEKWITECDDHQLRDLFRLREE